MILSWSISLMFLALPQQNVQVISKGASGWNLKVMVVTFCLFGSQKAIIRFWNTDVSALLNYMLPKYFHLSNNFTFPLFISYWWWKWWTNATYCRDFRGRLSGFSVNPTTLWRFYIYTLIQENNTSLNLAKANLFP